MQTIQTQRDLERLPQPRLILTAAPWVRRLATAMLTVAVVLCVGLAATATGPGAAYYVVGASIAAMVCFAVLIFARPFDWRAWVNVAATLDGLYLTASRTRLVFVPWQDVLDIGITRMITGKGGMQDVPQLKLRLSEADWSRFGGLSSIKGKGPVRTMIFPSFGGTAEATVERLKTFRGNLGRI